MKRLELTKGLSYTTRGFSCVKGKPFEVTDDKAAELMKTGRFATVGDVIEDASPAAPSAPAQTAPEGAPEQTDAGQDPDGSLSADEIAKLKKDELIELAQKHNIDISECNNNPERVEKICGMLGLASTVQLGLE